ncbi:two-component system, OmpR family, sensor histidine kinase KdpD [Anaerolineae bacterium]|nr:two-component system, OmpR family, sensor histidine kinase KdpD [Anaerolineae bacterium]
MDNHRPDPDELLAQVQAEEANHKRGKLKIFFGAAAGVGKTYAMLDAARQQKNEGKDVVIGIVETHGRAETQTLIADLELLPPKLTDYHGTPLSEFDLDAALARHPQLILLDELAHTNAPGARHAKRWQDAEELLIAGINVYSTLNVQHLESMNDVVAQITGIVVHETVPDSILEQADDVELIDLTPDQLLQRLKEGKVYIPQQAEQARRHFFRPGNLMALRELALRRTAERVDDQVQAYMRKWDIERTWPVTERLLVSIGPSAMSARLLRAGKRMATELNAEWIAVYVETREHAHLTHAERERLAQTLRLAEQLGAETVTLTGHSASEELLEFARSRNVTKIVVGKPGRSRWHERLFGSVVEDLVRQSEGIDVYIITGDDNAARPRHVFRIEGTINWTGYAWAIGTIVACTILDAVLVTHIAATNLVMVYLLAVTFIAARHGTGPSLLASILSVLAFDFFFVPPYLTFAVSDTQYIFTFAVMFIVAITISTLTVRIQRQADAARQRERRTAALYAMSRELASTSSSEKLVEVATKHIGEVLESSVAILLPDSSGRLALKSPALPLDASERAVAEWAYTHNQTAGLGTETLPGSKAFYLPLAGSHGTVGVLGIQPVHPSQITSSEQLHFLETFANQTALAIERANFVEESQKAKVQIETERTRNALLSSISHDLKTPLAAITGAAGNLIEATTGESQDLAQTIAEEADRLNRLIRNLLDMTRLEAGAMQVRKEWHVLEEIVGAVLTRLDDRLQGRPVTTDIPADLPLVPLDSVLIEQVLINLLENAIKYTPAGSPIEISANITDKQVLVQIADRGSGILPGDEERVFDKFYRARPDGGGVGLGLTVCRGIVQAHGGKIWAQNREGGGAAFQFIVPLEGEPPEVEPEITL